MADTVTLAKDGQPVEGETATRDAPYYCPGCGRRYKYMTECVGMTREAPHQPIEVVSTDELNGDPANHTPAPPTPTP